MAHAFSGSRRKRRGRKQVYRLFLEPLEPRSLLSTILVTTELDVVDTADELTSLREAVLQANSQAGFDTITFDSSLANKPILLSGGQMSISETLTIQGLGAAHTTVNGQNSSRLFDITNTAGAVTFDGLTLSGGKTTATNDAGGAIRSASSGQLTIQNCTIFGNSTTGGAQGFFSGAFGGGISAGGSVVITNSAISGNSTAGDGGLGGGIFTFGSVTVTNSTISGNSTAGAANGGGIFAWEPMTITNSTVTGNSVAKGDGGGVYSVNGSVTIRNSIVAGNLDSQDGSAPDVRPAGTLTVEFSLIGDNNGTGLTSAAVATSPNFNLIGTHAAPINPRLGPLADNGGQTLTQRPLTGSPVIDAGSNSLAVDPVSFTPLATDQRGAPFVRILGADVDMGAVEDRSLLAQPLPFSQNWTDTGLITVDDDWSGVPGIIGFRGDGLAGIADTDPQTILVDGSSTPIDVNANQTNPNILSTGGVAEFGIADPVVALQGSGTAAAPFLLLRLNTTGGAGIHVQYDLRDIDASADNAVQQVALQYRIGSSGNFANVPGGYVADASAGPSLADLITHVDVILPDDANNQTLLELRIITSNATGADEWIGIDNIAIDATTAILPPTLPFMQDWTDSSLITRDDNWSAVPGIIGFRGDGLAGVDTDPQMIVADGLSTPVDVIPNQMNPDTLTAGGVAEFDGITDPVVALQGSGTAAAPFLLLQVNTTGSVGIRVQYDLRDIDASADNAVQKVALQYRIGSSGDFVNVPAAYVADASSGPNLADLVTPVDVVLPADANNQPLVQLRIITSNAAGADEWIGIDNIAIRATPPNHAPTCTIGSPQNTTDESGLQSVPNWIINCSANDPGQNVTTISVAVDKPTLFTEGPAVDASGTLTYDPAPNVHDTASLTITIQDDGGTAAGGSDTTTVQVTFDVVKPHRLFNAAETGARRGLDVTGSTTTAPDGFIVAGDVLAVINYINSKGSGHVPDNSPFGPPFCDVNADDEVVAEDVIKIINFINAHPDSSEGENGEDIDAKSSDSAIDEVLLLLAMDTAGQPGHTRRGP